MSEQPSSLEIKAMLVGALSELWHDSYRAGNPTFQERQFCEVLRDAIYLATNRTTMKVES